MKNFVGESKRALIPHNKKHVQQENAYGNQLKKAGINKAHGLRHVYAQKLYLDLTGWACLAKGRSTEQELSDQQLKWLK